MPTVRPLQRAGLLAGCLAVSRVAQLGAAVPAGQGAVAWEAAADGQLVAGDILAEGAAALAALGDEEGAWRALVRSHVALVQAGVAAGTGQGAGEAALGRPGTAWHRRLQGLGPAQAGDRAEENPGTGRAPSKVAGLLAQVLAAWQGLRAGQGAGVVLQDAALLTAPVHAAEPHLLAPPLAQQGVSVGATVPGCGLGAGQLLGQAAASAGNGCRQLAGRALAVVAGGLAGVPGVAVEDPAAD